MPTARPVTSTAAKYALWNTVSPDAGADDAQQPATPGLGLPGRTAGAQRERPGEQDETARAAPEGQGEPRSLTRKISDAAAPAVPQATPATTRYSMLRPTGRADAAGKDI